MDSDGFVIASSSDVDANAQNGADFFEEAFESAAVTDNNFLDMEAGKIVSTDIGGSNHKDKPARSRMALMRHTLPQ